MDYKQKVEEKRQKLVDTLIAYIESNPAQWEAGWYSVPNETPWNGKTQKKYNGLNAFYLCVFSAMRGYKDPRWVTFNQAKELGANVKSGEKSSEIFYWSKYDKSTKQPFDNKTCDGMTFEEARKYVEENVRPVLKFYQVFNAAQCDNMPEYSRLATPEMEAEERRRQNAVIEQIITNSAALVKHDGGNRAYYSPAHDSIHLPEIKDFKTMQDYYATALHEIAHSTGHESRLDRNLRGSFGTPEYAKEELRAELASVFMQVEYGISVEGKHFENHGAYLASWLKSVKENQKEFFSASADAEKIAGYIADNYLREHKENEQDDKPKFEANTSFAKQVDAVLSGADVSSTHLKVMGTPLILRQLGAQSLPVLMTAKHLKNIVAESGSDISVNYHGIDVDLVKKLPELLADPVIVMDSMTKPDSVVVITSALDKKNRPIIGAIKFDGRGNLNDVEIDANILTSSYGKDNFENFLKLNLDRDTILYWDKEKSQELVKTLEFQLPDNLNSLTTNTIIRKSKAFVNSIDSKTEKKSEKLAEDIRVVSPLYAEYMKTQGENPHATILQRIGDFYEVMGANATTVAESLGLTLTGRDVGLSDRVPMCGFPYHAANEYISNLRESRAVVLKDENGEQILRQVTVAEKKAIEKAKEDAHAAGLPFSDKPYDGEEDFDQYVYDGSMSVEDYELMQSLMEADEQKKATAPEQGKKPIVINFYAGPGAGKTTAALELTAALKKAGVNVEYVSEYAKELVLEGKAELLSNQQQVTNEQYHRLDRLRDSIDVIVTDSPVLLGIVYGADRIDDAYRQKLRGYYDSFNNIDFHLERRKAYQTEGRVETEPQAKVLDKAISQMLQQQNISCRTFADKELQETVQLVKQAQQAEQARQDEQKERYERVMREDFPKDFIDDEEIEQEQDETIYGIIYNWKGLKEENSLYTESELALLDKDFMYGDVRYDGAFAGNKTYIALKLSRINEADTLSNIRDFLTGKHNDTAVNDDWYWETVKTNLFTGEENATTLKYIKWLNLSEQDLFMHDEQIRQVQQVGQAENTKEKYVIDLQLSYSNEMLLSNELKKLGYKRDDSVYETNEARDVAAFDAGTPYWLNEIRYNGQDGKMISGLYGRTSNGVLIEATDISRFTLDGLNRAEVEQFANVLREFGIEAKVRQSQEAEQADTVGQAQEAQQPQQAEPVEQAEQVRQVGQDKWSSIPLDATLIGAERGKSTQLKMPDGEYSSFVFFAPTKFIRQDDKSGSMQLSVNDGFKYTLMKGNQRVELSGSELRQAMAGKEIGKRAQRILSEANAQTLTDIYRNVPEEMRQQTNWCVFTTRWNEEKGKMDKQIFSPVLGLKEGGKMQWASIDKPETWATFDAAMKFAEDNDCAGLVYALDGKGISCIDLDKSVVKNGKLNDKPTNRAEGELSELAALLSQELHDTYIETSASGNGIHIFVKDDLLAKGNYKNRAETPDGEIEVYDDRRFMSMTGNIRSKTLRLGKSPVATTAWLQRKLGEKVAVNQNAQPSRQARQMDNSDAAVIERIRRSKKGAEFDALYRGENITGDNSRTDFKLLNMLAFFTDCESGQMERIFRDSALYRPDKGEAYVKRSVSKACETLQTRMSDRGFFGGENNRGGGRGNGK